jgi:hypothetical protein
MKHPPLPPGFVPVRHLIQRPTIPLLGFRCAESPRRSLTGLPIYPSAIALWFAVRCEVLPRPRVPPGDQLAFDRAELDRMRRRPQK